MTDPIHTAVRDAISHRYLLRPLPELTADTQLADLGFDSLDCVTVELALEEAGFGEVDLSGAATVGDIARAAGRVECG